MHNYVSTSAEIGPAMAGPSGLVPMHKGISYTKQTYLQVCVCTRMCVYMCACMSVCACVCVGVYVCMSVREVVSKLNSGSCSVTGLHSCITSYHSSSLYSGGD